MKRLIPDSAVGVESIMKRLIPDWAVGAMAGFVIGTLAGMSLHVFGLNPHGIGAVIGGGLGAVFGGWVGKQGGAIARWCAGMTAAVGGVSFAVGFVGPILLQPDSPQGPLLGFLYTGPLGAVAGALLGLAVGAVLQSRRAAASGPITQRRTARL